MHVQAVRAGGRRTGERCARGRVRTGERGALMLTGGGKRAHAGRIRAVSVVGDATLRQAAAWVSNRDRDRCVVPHAYRAQAAQCPS